MPALVLTIAFLSKVTVVAHSAVKTRNKNSKYAVFFLMPLEGKLLKYVLNMHCSHKTNWLLSRDVNTNPGSWVS